MTAVALVLLGLAFGLFLWSYLVYPILIARIPGRARGPFPPASPLSTEVIVSAADEEDVIGERVKNLLGQTADGPYRVTIGCDGCRDKTAQVAREAGNDRVRVVEFPERRGKAAVLNDLVGQSTADVLIFTDANTHFAEGAVARLLTPFGDPDVGAVCGRLVLEAAGGSAHTAETLFWNRETRLKEAEGRLGVCLGANGAIYAARRDRVRLLPEDSSMDDFLIPARIADEGRRVVFAGDAVAREPAPADVRAERRRRFRLGIGGGQVLRREGWLFDFPRHPALTFAFLSRKVARWLAPVLGFFGLLAAAFSPSLRPAALVALVVVAALLAWPVGSRPRGIGGKLYYFCVMNLVLAAGVLAGLLGMSRPAWSRTPRSKA